MCVCVHMCECVCVVGMGGAERSKCQQAGLAVVRKVRGDVGMASPPSQRSGRIGVRNPIMPSVPAALPPRSISIFHVYKYVHTQVVTCTQCPTHQGLQTCLLCDHEPGQTGAMPSTPKTSLGSSLSTPFLTFVPAHQCCLLSVLTSVESHRMSSRVSGSFSPLCGPGVHSHGRAGQRFPLFYYGAQFHCLQTPRRAHPRPAFSCDGSQASLGGDICFRLLGVKSAGS